MSSNLSRVICFICVLLSAKIAFAQQAQTIKRGVVTIAAHVNGRVNHGSGFVVKLTEGIVYIVTASHVVEGADHIDIRFIGNPGHDVPAKVFVQEGGNPRGIAILTAIVQPASASGILVMNTSPSIIVSGGDDVLVVGSPPGVGPWTVMKSSVKLKDGRDTIISGQFDAGFSGSPVVRDGQVVGMLTETTSGSGYAVPGLIVLTYLDGENIEVAGQDQVQESISARLLLKDYGINYDEESFLAAIKRRDLEAVELFLKAKPKWCDTRGSGDQTALIMAAHDGQPDIVNALIKAGTDVSATDDNGVTALMATAEGRELTSHNIDEGHIKVANALLAAHADIHATSKLGTALQLAAKSGNVDLVKLLLPKIGATTDEASLALLTAAEYGRINILKALLDGGVSPNSRYVDGQTAAVRERVELKEKLFGNSGNAVKPIVQDENVDASDPVVQDEILDNNDVLDGYLHAQNSGPTALMQAAKARSAQCVQLLVNAGANVNLNLKPNGFLSTLTVSALSFAVCSNDLASVKILLSAKADPNVSAITYHLVNGESYTFSYTILENCVHLGKNNIADALKNAGATSALR